MALYKNPKFDLKRKYTRTLEICIILALSTLVLAFKFFPKWEIQNIAPVEVQELITIEDVVATDQKTEVPPPPKPPIPIEAPSDTDLEDIEIADTELDIEEEVTTAPPPPKFEEDEEPEPVYEFFAVAEVMPTPIGGIEGIMKKINYPEFAQRAGIKGTVHIYAYVDEQGNVSKAEIAKGIGGGCDEEALAAILKTKFSPGKQRGRNVKVKVAVPVIFRIE